MAKNTHGFLFREFSVRPITRGLECDSCTNNRQVSWLTDHRAAYNLPDFSVAYFPLLVYHGDEIVQDFHLFPFSSDPLT